jgi:hypothetical protein
MIDIKIRYNTLCEDNHMFWRILINNIEYTASNIIVDIPLHTTKDKVYDRGRNDMVDKHHMSCIANEVIWKGDVVIIK